MEHRSEFYLCWDLWYTLMKFLSLSSSLDEDMNLMFSNAFKSDEFNLLLCNFALLLLLQISSYSLPMEDNSLVILLWSV